MIYGLGMLESGITFDFGQLVLDSEFARMIKHTVKGIPVDDGTLAVDVIKEVGPFADFLCHEHTIEHMRFQSQTELIDRNVRETWESKGARKIYQAAVEKVRYYLRRSVMSDDIFTRMGDGERLRMPALEVKEDIESGTEDAARKGKIPPLKGEEQGQLFDIMAEPSRVVSVLPGEEVIVTNDGCTMSFYSGQDGGGVGVPMSRMQAILTYERACGADTTSIGHSDYSYKQVKLIINFEMNEYYTTSMMTTVPFFYGAQPNMGLYFQPEGPCPNPAELMPAGNIREAQDAQEQAYEYLKKDLVFVGKTGQCGL